MRYIYDVLPFLSPVLAMAWTYKIVTKVKFDKLAYSVFLFLYIVTVTMPRELFLPLLIISFYCYSRKIKMSVSHSLFYTAYSIFWIILLGVAVEASMTFIFEEFSNNYMNWIHYASFFCAAGINYIIVKWFRIDFSLLKKSDPFIHENIIKPTNRVIISCIIILFLWMIMAENLVYSEVYAVFGGVYFSLLTSMYFIFMGILSTKIKTYLMYIIEEEKDQRYQELKKYTEDVELMQKEFAGFKHDTKNIWISFSEVIRSRDNQSIERAFNDIKERLEIQVVEADKVSHELSNMKETITKGLLHQKHSLAKEQNIEMQIDIKSEVTEIPMEMLDFVRIFGILMDNAIEEALESTKREVSVGFVHKKSKLIIEVMNSTDNEHIPVSKIFKDGYTTKEKEGENRGKGLAVVSNILKEMPHITLNTNHNHGLFNQTLIIWQKDES